MQNLEDYAHKLVVIARNILSGEAHVGQFLDSKLPAADDIVATFGFPLKGAVADNKGKYTLVESYPAGMNDERISTGATLASNGRHRIFLHPALGDASEAIKAAVLGLLMLYFRPEVGEKTDTKTGKTKGTVTQPYKGSFFISILESVGLKGTAREINAQPKWSEILRDREDYAEAVAEWPEDVLVLMRSQLNPPDEEGRMLLFECTKHQIKVRTVKTNVSEYIGEIDAKGYQIGVVPILCLKCMTEPLPAGVEHDERPLSSFALKGKVLVMKPTPKVEPAEPVEADGTNG